MALLYTDQFVGYATTGKTDLLQYLSKDWSNTSNTVPQSSTSVFTGILTATLVGQVHPTHFMRLGSTQIAVSGERCYTLSFSPRQIITVGMLCSIEQSSGTARRVLGFNTPIRASSSNTFQININGSLSLNGVTTATGLINPLAYNYFTVVADTVAGRIKVYVDSDVTTPVLDAPTTLTSITSVSLGLASLNGAVADPFYVRIGNVYILDSDGPAPFNAPLGVITYKPLNLESVYESGFVPNGIADPIAAINKTTRNFTTYNKSTLTNNGDLFNISNVSVAAQDTILGVVNHVTATKDSGNPRSLNMVISDGVNSISKNKSDLTVSSWLDNDFRFFDTAPDGTPWTFEKLAGLKVGYSAAN